MRARMCGVLYRGVLVYCGEACRTASALVGVVGNLKDDLSSVAVGFHVLVGVNHKIDPEDAVHDHPEPWGRAFYRAELRHCGGRKCLD